MGSPWDDPTAGKIGPGQPTMMDQAASMLLDQAGVNQAGQGLAALQQLRQGDWPNAANNAGIGTGEGAQAFGHGLYFAENEGVAQSYRDSLSARAQPKWEYDGQPITQQSNYSLWNALNHAGDPSQRGSASIPDWLDQRARELQAHANFTERTYGPVTAQMYSGAADKLKSIDPDKLTLTNPGKMYEVDINADPAKMLDWDKPLSQQSPEVQKVLADNWWAHPQAHADQTGGQIYESSKIVPGDYRDPAAASAALQQAGISGIRYLDQGSRAAGQGSSNYVVFDPSLINIVKKYAVPGLLTGGLGAGAYSQQQ